MKIATWNVNSLKVRLPQLLAWLAQVQPDIVALQETKTLNENFPFADINAAGYQVVFSGQKTYNGVAILSRTLISDVTTEIPDLVDPQRRILAATTAGIRIINLYVPNGDNVFSEKYQYKLNWLEKVTHYLSSQHQQASRLVVLGDFNIAPEPRDVHDPARWEGHVLFSEPERAIFAEWLKLGLQDVFRLFPQAENLFSWWDYRQGALHRNWGLRIDHILVNSSFAKECVHCEIDKTVRKQERPSDHAPVIATFN